MASFKLFFSLTKMTCSVSFWALLGLFFTSETQARVVSAREQLQLGKQIFEQSGANSCQYCHGLDGSGGKIESAAILREPKTWKVYNALGGDKAFEKDQKNFLLKLEEATVSLIQTGAVFHNVQLHSRFAEGFDWDSAGGPYNAQMLGLLGAPAVRWLRNNKDINKEQAAKAAFAYVKSFDTQSIFSQSSDKVEPSKPDKK